MKRIDDFFDSLAAKETDKETLSYIEAQRHGVKAIIGRAMKENNPMLWLPFVSLYFGARTLKTNGINHMEALNDPIATCDKAVEKLGIRWE